MKSLSRTLAISVAAACLIVATTASIASAASPAWVPIAASGPTNLPPVQSEAQRVSVDAEGGTFTLAFKSQTTTPIDFDAEASEVESALNALSSIGGAGGSVTVSGGPGDKGASVPYIVVFGGNLADVAVPQMTADSSGLSGGIGAEAVVSTVVSGGPGTTTIAIYAQNVGGVPSSGTATLTFTLPPGVQTTGTPGSPPSETITPWSCGPAGPGQSSITCINETATPPGLTLPVLSATVAAGPGAADGVVHVEVSGGGATGTAEYDMPLVVSAVDAPPGLQAFSAAAYDDNGVVDTRAGGHPFSASAGILVNSVRRPSGRVVPAGEFRDILVNTPPGFLGNPIATAACSEAIDDLACDPETVIATAQVPLAFGSSGEVSPVQNIEAPYGYPAKFRFLTGARQVAIMVAAKLRSDEDYGLQIGSRDSAQIKPVFGSFFTFWGTPAAAGHDSQRCAGYPGGTYPPTGFLCGPGGDNTAFLSNPTDCAEEAIRQPVARIDVNTWQNPELWFTGIVPVDPVVDCENLEFEADFTFEPSDTKADSPAAFRTELAIPSEGLTDPSKLMTPTVRESVVTLPEGIVLNASAADGLAACSKEQIGLKGTNFPRPNQIRFTTAPQTCPDASKIGSGELKSELLADPLEGGLYLAAQGEGNPFGSLFALYLVIEDPRHGVFIKLPGEVQVSEATGQQRIVFRDLPQLPFTYLRLNLKGGNRSPLASPTTCGDYVTTATNTPWSAPESGPPTVSANGFTVNQGPNGLPCANTPGERPFEIGWSAGSESTKAGASAPFHMRITRADGSQELTGMELKTPRGVSASLKGVPRCSDAQIEQARNSTGKAEQANGSCPIASKVGTLTTGAGSGPSPFYVSGNLYLAGPYKGAPLSVVAVTPAVAGPFDLGNVVVRAAARIDRHNAQVIATADEIPQILKGVALRIKDVRIKLDRDNWTINPTSCEASAVELSATGANGAVANRSARFQVGGCGDLAFKPKLTARVIGGTKRNKYPAFEAKLTMPEGSKANIKDVQVTLPHSQFLEQAHIRTICTRVQAAVQSCPQGSIYGYAEAETPLLDGKLTGPVFLKSSDNKLPDLAIFLRGPDSEPVEVEFQGRIDSVNASIRNTIEGLPDVPISSFTLKMKGGKQGLLVNSRNLCKGKPGKLTVKMVGQNNWTQTTRPRLGNSCGKKGKGKAKKTERRAKRGSAKHLAVRAFSW